MLKNNGRKSVRPPFAFSFLIPLPSQMPFLNPTPSPPFFLLALVGLPTALWGSLGPVPLTVLPGQSSRPDQLAPTIPVCPRHPQNLPEDPATWDLRPGDPLACVLLGVLDLSLTWSDPGPEDRTVRTGQDRQGMGLAVLICQKHKPSLPGQARPGQTIGLSELWAEDLPTLVPTPLLSSRGAPRQTPFLSTYCAPKGLLIIEEEETEGQRGRSPCPALSPVPPPTPF